MFHEIKVDVWFWPIKKLYFFSHLIKCDILSSQNKSYDKNSILLKVSILFISMHICFFINFDNWLIFSCSSSKTVLLHFQMCCYDSSFGFIINSIPTAGSMLTANPFVDPSKYYNDNVVPKENCCDLSDNCRLYYDARPVGRCYFRSPFAICKYFLNAGKHRHSWHGITPPF
jgi:hypothetical protein